MPNPGSLGTMGALVHVFFRSRRAKFELRLRKFFLWIGLAIAILTFLNSTTKDCCFIVFSRHLRRIKVLVADSSTNQRKAYRQ